MVNVPKGGLKLGFRAGRAAVLTDNVHVPENPDKNYRIGYLLGVCCQSDECNRIAMERAASQVSK